MASSFNARDVIERSVQLLFGHLSGRADLEVYVAALEHAADVGLIRAVALQQLEGGRLVAESLQERVRETLCVERLLCKEGNGFFDFNGIHVIAESWRS